MLIDSCSIEANDGGKLYYGRTKIDCLSAGSPVEIIQACNEGNNCGRTDSRSAPLNPQLKSQNH